MGIISKGYRLRHFRNKGNNRRGKGRGRKGMGGEGRIVEGRGGGGSV